MTRYWLHVQHVEVLGPDGEWREASAEELHNLCAAGNEGHSALVEFSDNHHAHASITAIGTVACPERGSHVRRGTP